MPTLTAAYLQSVTSRIFQAAGVPGETAERVSASLVESNLVGHDSHGVIRIMSYLRDLRQNLVDPQAQVEVLQETPTTALLDGHWGFGQVVAARAMAVAIAKAREERTGVVAARRSYHIGRLGEYALMAAGQGLIGLVMCNSAIAAIAPFGGCGRALGSNPLAWAVPAGGRPPFLLDFSTGMCAEGKLRVARSKGQRVPEGWILDRDGRPTTSPQDFYDGGAILPAAGHKGYALGLLIEILGGVLTGHGCALLAEHGRGNGFVMWALDVAAFCPLERFQATLDALCEGLKAGRKAPGVDEILIPGEPEFRTREFRLREGIPVPASTWQEIVQEAGALGVEVESR